MNKELSDKPGKTPPLKLKAGSALAAARRKSFLVTQVACGGLAMTFCTWVTALHAAEESPANKESAVYQNLLVNPEFRFHPMPAQRPGGAEEDSSKSVACWSTAATDIFVAYVDDPKGGNLVVLVDGQEKLNQPANQPFVDSDGKNQYIENRRGICGLAFGRHKVTVQARGGPVTLLGLFTYDSRENGPKTVAAQK